MYTATPCCDAPVPSVWVKLYAWRWMPATCGQLVSGAALNFVVTVGSPTGLTTGDDGQFATTERSSASACVADFESRYNTASVLKIASPFPSSTSTCSRAVRNASLANVPLQRSSVAAPATESPPSLI